MFGKKSNITKQIELKNDLIGKIQNTINFLEKGKYNKDLNRERMVEIIGKIKDYVTRLENSVGDGQTDIKIGCEKVKNDLSKFKKVAISNLVGEVEDWANDLCLHIEEIIDLENDKITSIDIDDPLTSKQDKFIKKLNEIDGIEDSFGLMVNNIESNISKLERNIEELNGKLLSEPNNRKKEMIFLDIKSINKNIDVYKIKAKQYKTCENIINTIKTYTKIIVEANNILMTKDSKINIILNIDRLKTALEDPVKLKMILTLIKNDIIKAVEDTEKIVDVSDNMFDTINSSGNNETISSEMQDYMNNLIQNNTEKSDINAPIADLDSFKNELEKNK